jgi:hypothetical protein
LFARPGSDGVQRGHEDVYWFGQNVPASSGERLVLLALEFIVGVTKTVEGSAPMFLWLERVCVFVGLKRVVICLSCDALHGRPVSPFMDEREGGLQ